MLRTPTLALVSLAAAFAAQPPSLTGLWDATVRVGDAEIPFRFEISAAAPGKAAGAFFDGDDRVLSLFLGL